MVLTWNQLFRGIYGLPPLGAPTQALVLALLLGAALVGYLAISWTAWRRPTEGEGS